MHPVLREPVFHFLVLGCAIFAAGQLWPHNADRLRIEVNQARIDGIARKYQAQYGAMPSPGQLHTLVDADIHGEILFQEGLSMGLDRDDEIVRRRIIQKAEFLLQDLVTVNEPTRTDIAAYYRQHAQDYIIPERVSFTHVYFSPDNGGDESAQARARVALAKLGQRPRAPEAGDRFFEGYDYAALGRTAVARVFGDSPLASAVFLAPIGRWVGPFRSGFGWHLVRVSSREPARTPNLAEIEGAVRGDWKTAAQARANAEAFARVRAKYRVIMDVRP